MPIEHGKGHTMVTGDSIDFLQLAALKGAVSLELQGLKRRGRPAWCIAKEHFNIKGNKQKVYEWLCAKVDELRPLQEHVTEEGRRIVGGQEVQ